MLRNHLAPRLCLTLGLLVQSLFAAPAYLRAQESAPATEPAQQQTSERSGAPSEGSEGKEDAGPPQEDAREVYLGRRVAPFMSHLGAPWLIRGDRNAEEATDRVMKQLELKPGMVVCDLGCGNGYYTLRFARQVAPGGKVLAVDIQPEMLEMLVSRASRARAEGVEPILGEVNHPKLPDGQVDMIFLADVYHEFSHPESMLYWMRRALKPDGVIALLEFREEDPTVPILPLHKMGKDQIMKEYTSNGYKLVREFNGLPIQHLMFFARDDSPLEAIEPQPFTGRPQ